MVMKNLGMPTAGLEIEDESMPVQIQSLKSLNTFTYDWQIKARVTKKHERKTWKN